MHTPIGLACLAPQATFFVFSCAGSRLADKWQHRNSVASRHARIEVVLVLLFTSAENLVIVCRMMS
eukprot:2201912-Pleurochrysis_carterae.AAC.1